MYQISNFTDNDDVKIISRLGAFQVIEYQRDQHHSVIGSHSLLQRPDECEKASAGL